MPDTNKLKVQSMREELDRLKEILNSNKSAMPGGIE